MAYLVQVQRGIDFIEANLRRPIEPRDVTRAAGMSHWHYQRIFKALTGDTLAAYIRHRRLAGAAAALRVGEQPILEIALAAGFGSQAAFSRAFKAVYAMPPGAYRAAEHPGPVLPKVTLDLEALRHLYLNLNRQPRLRREPERVLVGLRTAFDGTRKNELGTSLPVLWEAFLARASAVAGRVDDDHGYGAMATDPQDPTRLWYLAGVEVAADAPVPSEMARVVVPAATYARFEHRGPAVAVDHTVSFAYGTWLTQVGMRHTGGPDLEIYDARFRPEAFDSAFDFALPVVRETVP
ncbi:MAG: helix-turn-helix domain-containing protein [Myxococcales bacterium]|nr:helix-turn-helix domain-containing protein [Myxococcales bacterium]